MATTIYRKPRTLKYYMQWRGSWADKPFSNKTVAEVGCGLLAVTHCAKETEQYKGITPNKFRKYMNQFTTPDHGVWGTHIPEALEHIGLTDVKEFKGDIVGGKMRPFYDEMEKGDRVGIILFQNPLRNIKNKEDIPEGVKYTTIKNDDGTKTFVQQAPDGEIWCETGHFVAVCGMKKINKTYYLYIKDSGDEEHEGFFSYIKSMKGCVKWLWTGKVK